MKKKVVAKTLAEKLLEGKPKNRKVEEYRQLAKVSQIKYQDPLLTLGYRIILDEREEIAPPGKLRRNLQVARGWL